MCLLGVIKRKFDIKPLFIPQNCQILAQNTLDFKFGTQLAFGTSLTKTTFLTKIGGSLGQGSIQKSWDPLPIFATVEASD